MQWRRRRPFKSYPVSLGVTTCARRLAVVQNVDMNLAVLFLCVLCPQYVTHQYAASTVSFFPIGMAPTLNCLSHSNHYQVLHLPLSSHSCCWSTTMQSCLGDRSTPQRFLGNATRIIACVLERSCASLRVLEYSSLHMNLRKVQALSLLYATPCSPMKVAPHFGGTYCFHLHDSENKPSINPAMFLIWLTLLSLVRRQYILPKRRLTNTGLHDVTFQKTEELFIVTAERT
jgi:hypothetical protein